MVLANNRIPGLDLPCVVSDEFGSVKLALEHLMSRGHRRIAMVAGRFSPYIVAERYSAFLEVTRMHGIQVEDHHVKMCEANVESAAQVSMELLTQKDRPTAVLGANDVIAAGVLKARPPAGAAGAGGCGGWWASMIPPSALCLEPELTSVHINCRRMGELCVERLRSLLRGEECPPLTVIPSELKVRGTT